MVEEAIWIAVSAPQPYNVGIPEAEWETYAIGVREGVKAAVRKMREMGLHEAADAIEEQT